MTTSSILCFREKSESSETVRESFLFNSFDVVKSSGSVWLLSRPDDSLSHSCDSDEHSEFITIQGFQVWYGLSYWPRAPCYKHQSENLPISVFCEHAILSSCFRSLSKFFVDFQFSFSRTFNAALILTLSPDQNESGPKVNPRWALKAEVP